MRTWSNNLTSQTRSALAMPRAGSPDGNLHFKSADQRFASAKVVDLANRKLALTDKDSGEVHHFKDIDEWLNAGWVID